MKKLFTVIGLLSLSLSALALDQKLECQSADGQLITEAVIEVISVKKQLNTVGISQAGYLHLKKNKDVILTANPISFEGLNGDQVFFMGSGSENGFLVFEFSEPGYGKAGTFKGSVSYTDIETGAATSGDLTCTSTIK